MTAILQGYEGLRPFRGDLHNHCGISYAHGTIEEAYTNARLQLDFASVTGHAAWPDMTDNPMPPEVIAYHSDGFHKLSRNWDHYCAVTEQFNVPGSFTTFFGYEFHSFRHGDRTCISPYRVPAPDPDTDYDTFRQLLAQTDVESDGLILLPHHIGYARGFRGIDWYSVTDRATPIVEILSMHGLAERDEPWFPYLHTMGPLDPGQTMVAGLQQGHHFGVVASTDHHSAHPGSYGHGSTVVWSEECTRPAIWNALLRRRTYAVSGDRITLQFSIDGHPMGSRIMEQQLRRKRLIELDVEGGDAIARIEIIRNGEVLHSHTPTGTTDDGRYPVAETDGPSDSLHGKVLVEMGWGERNQPYDWNLHLEVQQGRLIDVEPRLRGRDVVDPLDVPEGACLFSRWSRTSDSIRLQTRTFGNPTTTTSQTQAICLEIDGTPATRILVGHSHGVIVHTLESLIQSAQVAYTSGFVSPAIRIHRFVPRNRYCARFTIEDTGKLHEDFYYVRVIQKNGHGAWSSPIWVTSMGKEA